MSKEMLELADRITSHLVTLASTNMKLSLTEWGIISNDMLSAIAALRASAVAEPVAWQWRRKSDIGGFGGWSVTSIRPIGEVYDLAPLYTHPAPAAPNLQGKLAGSQAAQTIDDTPSCGQENDYRRAKPEAVPTREWRCFHCDEVFTDSKAAANHFGVDHLDIFRLMRVITQ